MTWIPPVCWEIWAGTCTSAQNAPAQLPTYPPKLTETLHSQQLNISNIISMIKMMLGMHLSGDTPKFQNWASISMFPHSSVSYTFIHTLRYKWCLICQSFRVFGHIEWKLWPRFCNFLWGLPAGLGGNAQGGHNVTRTTPIFGLPLIQTFWNFALVSIILI